MPVYSYKCSNKKCKEVLEITASIHDSPRTYNCKVCGKPMVRNYLAEHAGIIIPPNFKSV